MLNVEHILEERYPDFVIQHTKTASRLSRFLSFLFYESRFQQFGREYPHLEGFDFVEAVLRHFDFTLRLREDVRARILNRNDGDWVENCTALLENEAGQLKLLRGIASQEERTEVLFVAA